MFEGTKARGRKIKQGYETTVTYARRAAYVGAGAAVLVVAVPNFIEGFQNEEATPDPNDRPAAAAPANRSGGRGAVSDPGQKVRLAPNTRLYNQANTDGGDCAYIPEAEATEQIGKPKNDMVPIATPVEGDGRFGADNFIDIPLQKDCNPTTVWVKLGDIATLAK